MNDLTPLIRLLAEQILDNAAAQRATIQAQEESLCTPPSMPATVPTGNPNPRSRIKFASAAPAPWQRAGR
jgi:hypothetical protein